MPALQRTALQLQLGMGLTALIGTICATSPPAHFPRPSTRNGFSERTASLIRLECPSSSFSDPGSLLTQLEAVPKEVCFVGALVASHVHDEVARHPLRGNVLRRRRGKQRGEARIEHVGVQGTLRQQRNMIPQIAVCGSTCQDTVIGVTEKARIFCRVC